MKITLTNFGCWKNYSAEFNEDCMTLLTGSSGAGKTTIMRAIVFALFGVGTKIVRDGCSTCKVELEFDQIKIVRTKGPSRLLVYTETDKLEDDEAQSLLNSKFKSIRSVYLEQNGRNTFVGKSPAEKLEFLEELAFSDSTVKTLKERLNLKIKSIEKDLLKYDLSFARVSQEISKKQLPKEPELAQKISKETDLVEMMNNLKSEISGNYEKIQLIDSKINSAKKLEQIQIRKSFLENSIRNIIIRDLDESQLEKLDFEISQDQLLRELAKLVEIVEADKQRISAIDQELTEIPGNLDELLYIEQARKSLVLPQIPIMPEKSYIEISDEIDDLTDMYSCPQCSATLHMENGELVLADSRKLSPEEIKSRLDYLKSQLKIAKEYERIIEIHRDIQGKLDKLPKMEYPLSTLEKFRENRIRLNSVRQTINLKSNIERIKKLEGIVVKSNIENIDDLLAKRDQLLKSIAVNDRLKAEKQKLTSELSNLETSNNVETLVENVPELIKTRESLELSNRNLNEEILKIRDLIEFRQVDDSINLLKSELEILEKNIQTEKLNLIACSELKSIIQKAEGIALKSVVDSLNSIVNEYVEAFFQDEPMSARISMVKTNKSGKSIDQLNIEIQYKGIDMDLKMLSGGEYDRIVLAFVLAIMELENSPLILLDECIGSLDSITADRVCEFIQTRTGRCIILIAHQISVGMFAEVLEIKP